MTTASATSAIAAALSGVHVQGAAFQDGPESTLLLFRPADRRRYPAATAMAAIREQGLRLIGTRDLKDGRVAIEFGRTDRPGKGLATLCHQNVALGLDALAAQGWTV